MTDFLSHDRNTRAADHHHFALQRQALPFFHGHHAVLADSIHYFSNQVADLGVAS